MRMKRTNVVLDEKVLENARQLSGEKTYSATINRALQELVKKLNGQQAARRLMELLSEPDAFYPGYAEDLYGREWVLNVQKKLGHTGLIRTKGLLHDEPSDVAAMRVSAPRKKKRRGSRR